jgi:hypothetical protein
MDRSISKPGFRLQPSGFVVGRINPHERRIRQHALLALSYSDRCIVGQYVSWKNRARSWLLLCTPSFS